MSESEVYLNDDILKLFFRAVDEIHGSSHYSEDDERLLLVGKISNYYRRGVPFFVPNYVSHGRRKYDEYDVI